jgi:hypothetical protein
MPATTQPGRLVWTPRLKGESASESIDAQDPGTPQQGQPASASTPAGAMPAPVLVEMSSAPQLPTPLESVAPAGSGPAGSAPADGACGKPASTREEKAASSGASNAAVPESPIAWRPVVPGTVPVPTAVAQMLAATPSSSDGKADSGPDAGSGTAADRYGDPAPKQGAPEAYLKISAAPSGDPRATSGSSEPCATGSDAGFVQAVAQILGDAEITDVRVTLGSSSAARRTGESGSAMTRADAGFAQAVTRILGNADLTNARVSLANSTAQVKRSESSLGDEHAAPSSAPQKAAAIATGSPSATGIVPERPRVIPRELVDRFSVGKRERADGTVNGEQTATAVSTEGRSAAGDSPRLLRDVIARLAADQIPALEQPKARAHDSASERTLPAPRQDLPASDDHPTAESSDSRTSGPERPKAASDVQASGSASPAGQNDASQKSDSRPREVVAGEARNLRDGVPTREQPAGVADRVTLQVADADGRQTRIRVSVLGDQVRAVIQPPDAEAARHLEHRMDELQGALVRQGFVNPRVTVQLAGTSAETGSPWGGAAGNGTSDRAPSRGTDQPAGDQRQGSGRREQERQGEGQSHSRQRSPQRDPRDRRR